MSDSTFKIPERIPQYYYKIYLNNQDTGKQWDVARAGESPENPLIIPEGRYIIQLRIDQDLEHKRPKSWSVKLPLKSKIAPEQNPDIEQDPGKRHYLKVGIQGENQSRDMKLINIPVDQDVPEIFEGELSKGPAKVMIVGVIRLKLVHEKNGDEDVQCEPQVSLDYFLQIQ